ncbi:MAG: hypothetical protein ABIP78_05310 [Pyrinomonadaceae bacterium]
MDTITLTISLPNEVGIALKNKAKKNGKRFSEYVEDVLSCDVKRLTFRDLFSDVRQSNSLTDEEMEKEIDAAIAESRQARKKLD